MADGLPIAAILPLLLVGVAFLGYCLYDLAHQPKTRYLPKPVWAVITVISIPLGGVLYLLFGRSTSTHGGGDGV
ncbi:PLDc N-terminal domain-containing protein [Streptomyces violascens]|uniref:PLDc N-terminal domain-containing protein n=1 Tax=Streptomyces violascens TaxID=67381 RepID=UPI0037BDA5F5